MHTPNIKYDSNSETTWVKFSLLCYIRLSLENYRLQIQGRAQEQVQVPLERVSDEETVKHQLVEPVQQLLDPTRGHIAILLLGFVSELEERQVEEGEEDELEGDEEHEPEIENDVLGLVSHLLEFEAVGAFVEVLEVEEGKEEVDIEELERGESL